MTRVRHAMLDFRWRCRDGVLLAPRAGGIGITVDDWPEALLSMPSDLIREALRFDLGLSDSAIGDMAGSDIMASTRLFRLRHRLRKNGLLVVDMYGGDRRLARMRPLSPAFDPLRAASRGASRADRRSLSRFALMRREDGQLVLEHPEAPCDFVLEDRDLVGWIHDAAATVVAKPVSVQAAVLALLGNLGFVEDPDEEEAPDRRTWEFHDRFFHRRSRNYPDFRPTGGTFRIREPTPDGFAELLPSPPAKRAAHAGETIDLPVPKTIASASLLTVMETRRSQRKMGDIPPTLEQVATLLYRVARVTRCRSDEILFRPYPSGGALHELEFYLAVGACRGLDPGLYHYRGDIHAMTRLCPETADPAAAAMLSDCARSWNAPEESPHCLIVVSSRLPRLAWKYTAIAYRVSLLNAGVVLQSLYLVATDLGLAGCAAGSGDPDRFAHATGVSSWEETSIAEFGFGSRADCPPSEA